MKPKPPDPEIIQAVRQLVDRTSLNRAAEDLGLAKATVARIAAGLPVHEGTVLVVRARIGGGRA